MTNAKCDLAALRPCPICQQSSVERLHTMRFALPTSSPLPISYDVVACGHCGFVYADTAGRAEDYARHYTDFSLYEDPTTATGSGGGDADKHRFDVMASLFCQEFHPATRILDIGCGSGGLLRTLRDRGFHNLVGMDPSAGCVSQLTQLGISGVQGTLDSISESVEKFDLIILSHVVEHLLDPVGAVAALRRILAPNGRIYLEAPDALRYQAYPFVPFYFFDAEHINHFDSASLANLAVRSGYAVDCIANKDIPVAGGHLYPTVYGIFSSMPGPGPREVSKAEELRPATARYVENCTAQVSYLFEFDMKLKPDVPLAIWGAGSFAQRFMELPWVRQRQILAVVDRDRRKHGLTFAGCTISGPAQGLRNLPPETTILILVALDADSAVREYVQLGLPYRYRTGSQLLAPNPVAQESEE